MRPDCGSRRHDRQQLAHGIGQSLGAAARLGKRSEGIRVGGDQGAMAIIAALEINTDHGAVVSRRGCGMRAHRRQGAHAVQQGLAVTPAIAA